MSGADPRLVAALRAQAARRPAGARPVGWKVGGGERERIGGELAVGYLTSASVLEPGATYAAGGEDTHADEEVVAGNVFHRAVALGTLGSVVQVRVSAGDLVVAELDGLGRVPLAIA